MDALVAGRIAANPHFVELQRKRSAFAWTLTVVMVATYLAFIFLVAFAPDVMAIPVTGVITLGFPLGLGVILLAIILTGVYVARANGEFDRLTRLALEGSSAYAPAATQTATQSQVVR